MKTEIPQQIFEKYTNIKFHENPSKVSRAVPCGLPDNGYMTKLTGGCRNSTKDPHDV
jgi:hypothetical protein